MTPTGTEVSAIVVLPTLSGNDDTPGISTPGAPDTALPPEAVVAGGALLLILFYVALYLRGAAVVERYANGFVIQRCPVCRQGTLDIERRMGRTLGIPNARHTVHCTHCRSVLRETGEGQWRYAVDPLPNAHLYERLNNQTLDEAALVRLAQETDTRAPMTVKRPDFVDEDEA